jgi:hypothetical protein
MKMKTIELKNSEWYRGKGADGSYLYESNYEKDGKPNKCCIGVLSCSLGFKPEEINSHTSVNTLFRQFRAAHTRDSSAKKFKSLNFLVLKLKERDISGFGNSQEGFLAMTINDDPTTTDDEKVVELNNIFREHGFNFVFVADK